MNSVYSAHNPPQELREVPPKSSSPQPDSIDERARSVLAALQANDFDRASAFRRPDEAALPQEKLARLWQALTAQYGALQSWTLEDNVQREGKAVRIFAAKFERGEVDATIAPSIRTRCRLQVCVDNHSAARELPTRLDRDG